MEPLTKCSKCLEKCSLIEPSGNTNQHGWGILVLSRVYICVNDHAEMFCKLCDYYIGVTSTRWVSLFTHIINHHWHVVYDGYFYGSRYLIARDKNYMLYFDITSPENYHFIFLTGDCNSAIMEFNNSYEGICYGRKILAKYLIKCIICGMFYECPPTALIVEKHIIATHLLLAG